MAGNASSSRRVTAESRKTGAARELAANCNERYFFLQRRSALRVILPATLIVLALVTLTFGVTLGEIPEDYDERAGYAVLLVLMAIPVWFKLPITIPLIAEAISTAIAWHVFSRDDYPDFSISPHSIWGLEWMSYRRFSWSQIERIEVNWINRTSWYSSNSSVSRQLIFYTNVPRNFPIIGKSLQLNHFISLTTGISEADKDEILELIREFAPDKTVFKTADRHF